MCAINNLPLGAVEEINLLLGKLLSFWKHVQFNRNGYLTQDKCENPAGLFVELESYPMHQWVNCIEGKHFIIPDLNIGLQGSKPPGEVKKNIFSSGVDGSKSHLSLWRKAVIFARTAGIYFVLLPNFWSK